MENNDAKIKQMYKQDAGLILIFIIFVWLVLGYVLMSVSGLAPSDMTRYVLIGTGTIAGVFVTSALIAVLVHLKKNRINIYREECFYEKMLDQDI